MSTTSTPSHVKGIALPLTDKDIIALFHLGTAKTLRERLRNGPPRNLHRNQVDIRLIPFQWSGRTRLWSRAVAQEIINPQAEAQA